MSHLLDSMFSVRQMPWHGLGTILDTYPANWDEARKLAGLDWEPIATPVYDKDLVMAEDGSITEVYREIPGFASVKRSDNGKILYVPQSTYTIFPNADLGPLVEAVLNQGGGKYEYETAGSLDDGKKVWALIRAAEPFEVPGDPNGAVLPYVAIQNNHDGMGSLRVQRLRTRIVCANTSHAADLEAERHGVQFVFRHSKNMMDRVDFAKQVLAGMSADQVAAREWAADLISVKVTEAGKRAFVESFIPMPVADMVTDRVANNVEAARKAVYGFLASPTCEGINDTAYGLVQAAVEYLDHGRASRNAGSKFSRCVLSPEPMKRRAEFLAREAALVS
jgi:phage/plasmid-like protein (TIGR03299 family)